MTAKEYLNQAYVIDRRIKMILAKSQKMRDSLYCRGQKLNDTVCCSGNNEDNIGAMLSKVIDYEQKAYALVDELVDKRLEIERTIQAVPDSVQREILERRYLLYQDWESHFNKKTGEYIKGIGEQMNYSDRQIYRLHDIALAYVSANVSECQS